MENVVLTIHLILALCLVGVVLLQRSEGGGLGIGGASSMSGRPALTGLAKLTWAFAVAFICTSIALTLFAAQNAAGTSVVDQFGGSLPAPAPAAPAGLAPGADLLPPAASDAPLAPPAPAPAPAPGAPATQP